MSIQTRTAQNVITKEIVDDRIVGTTLPYACSGFCPTPCGENCSCEAKRFIDPFKRLMWRLGKVNQVFTVEISPRPQLVAGLVDPSPEILRAPVSGIPCVMFHVVAYEYVDARSPGAVDFDSIDVDGSRVMKGEGFDNEGTFVDPQRGVCEGLCCDNMIWVKRFEEVKTADFYLSDPNYTSATHPNGPQLFVPAKGPNGAGSEGNMLALDFLPMRADRTRRGVLSIYFTGRELVIPHNITDLGARHGFKHSRTRRRVMRYEERTYCVGDPVAIMGVVGKGVDPFGKPVPCISPMLEQELPEAYYQLLKMTESERQTLLSVQGKMIITGDMQSLEPPFIGCACFSEWEPCGGCTPAGCSKLC